jgi:hypothetical protein
MAKNYAKISVKSSVSGAVSGGEKAFLPRMSAPTRPRNIRYIFSLSLDSLKKKNERPIQQAGPAKSVPESRVHVACETLPSALQAKMNFARAPWARDARSNRLRAISE